MIARAFKLRFRRRIRMQRRNVEALGQQAEQQLERNFFKRLERLVDVRRFVASWLLLLVLLGSCVAAQISSLAAYYQSPQPVAGGTYTEGILGAFTNANPLYAVSPVDATVSKLLFGSLFTYDESNKLIGDLALDYAIDARGTTYTVRLKPNLKWHDGKPLTATDVAFTYELIQNPDARSPLNASWQGIKVVATDAQTVTFTLPNQLISFPYSMTNGIVPKHILGDEPVTALRSLPFNSSRPVGSGPFKINAVQVTGGSAEDREEYIGLDVFADYHNGKPALDRFVVHSFRNKDGMIESFKKNEIDSMVGLTEVPAALKPNDIWVYNMPLTAAVMAFFKTSEGVLASTVVRQALVRAADTSAIIQNLEYPTMPVRSPLLPFQTGYNPLYNQPVATLTEASALLDGDGWIVGDDGIRSKAGVPLSFVLTVQEGSEYANVALMLKQQWRKVGVDVKVDAQGVTDFQATLAGHTYDALLHGIAIGVDPDVYVYWDSKSADARSLSRLNFSEYRSAVADAALQAGRTRSDPTLRAVKYQPFLQAWQADAPALALYQPRLLYITRSEVASLTEHPINTEVERLTTVHQWMIRRANVSQTSEAAD